ncbi:MAG: prepilin peptidase [Anaerovoracaceae bacterium]
MEIAAYSVIYIIFFLFGITIGSFLNVLIYRIPRGLSPANGRSYCPGCNNTLRGLDLIPVISYFKLNGKCRHCGCDISSRYPWVEFLGGAAAVLSVFEFFVTPKAIIAFLVLSVLIVITYIDIDIQEIPDRLNLSIFLLGVASIFVTDDVVIGSRLIGFVAVALPMVIITIIIKDAFGGGDIKLCAAAGFLLGIQGIVVGAFIGIILGGLYGIYLLVTKKKDKKDHFAFGPFLSFGIGISLFWGEELVNMYLNLFGF